MTIKVLFGGGGSEDSISEISKNFLINQLDQDHEVIRVNKDDFSFLDTIKTGDYVIPCIHGYPGETGELAAALELKGIKFLGCGSKASVLCFNKILTKLFLEANGVKTTPFIFISKDSSNYLDRANKFFDKYQGAFVKASSEGSSKGCYPVTRKQDLSNFIDQAFQFSDHVLLEKMLSPRELEIAAFEYDGKLHVSLPGEVLADSGFYSYEEKYSTKSKAKAEYIAKNLSQSDISTLQDMAKKIFKICNLKDLSRIDFFKDGDHFYLNEVNTFPGMTSISLFPKMLEETGTCSFKEFLMEKIE